MKRIFVRENTFKEKLYAVMFTAGIQAIIIFRISSRLCNNKLARKLRLHLFFYRLNQFLCQVDIAPEAEVGELLFLPHPSGIVIGDTAVIGRKVTIMQHVTIGTRRLGETGKRHATIEDNVFIGPNVLILGNVRIGESSRIAAGSIVLADVGKGELITGIHR